MGSVEINDFSGEVRPLNNGRVAVGNSGNPNPTNPGGFVRTVNVAAPQIIGEVRNMLADNLATNASRDAVFATSGDRAGIDVFAVGTDGQLTLLKTFILGIGQYFVGSGVPQNDHVRAIVYKPGQTPPPVVVGVAVNGTAAQRSRVTSVSVTFSAQVAFADPANVAAAFQLARIGGGAVGGFTATVAIVDGATVVTLNGFSGAETQFGSLADGRYRLTVRASQVIGLDGDGNGTGGDDFTLTGSVANGLYRLYGDTNGDATVNAADFGPFRAAFGSSAVQAGYLDYLDFNGDGIINAFDFAQFRLRFGSGVP